MADQSKKLCPVPRGTVKTIEEELQTVPTSQQAQAERIGKNCLPRYQKLYFRAVRGELSPRMAIKAMCFHCVGWERFEAYGCTARGCPLWRLRPKGPPREGESCPIPPSGS